MRHRLVIALVGTWFAAGSLFAADEDLKGKIVKVDADARKVTIQTDNGKHEYLIDAQTKFLVGKVVSKDGAKDKHLVPGAQVVYTTTPGGKTLRVVHLAVAAVDPKTEPRPKPKEEPDEKDSKSFKDIKGTLAKVLRVDLEKRTAQVQLDGGKTLELKLDKDVKFIGPPGRGQRPGHQG
jgi:hypothetical protein